MSFDADWLQLREPFDRQARPQELIDRIAALPWRGTPLRIVDLGAGTGQFMRHLAHHLPRPQIWRLVDGDVGLLRRAGGLPRPAGVAEVEMMPADLASAGLEPLLTGADLVVTTAFLDLVTADWLSRLADSLATHDLPFYASLSVDGRQVWTPPDRLDDAVMSAFEADQRRNKGFGPALGVDAPSCAAMLLRRRGFTIAEARSDWRIDGTDPAMLEACLSFQAGVAAERDLTDWAGWRSRRRREIANGNARLVIPHRDLLALPQNPVQAPR